MEILRKWKNTPLYLACKNGYLEIVKILIENNACLEMTCDDDSTPLHIACENNHLEIVKFLITEGVDVNRDNGSHFFFWW